MKKVELLAPAGNISKLKTALHFGADAVYLGGKEFGLRAFSDNFDYDELKKGVIYAHNLNRKVYVTVNIFPRTDDFVNIENYLKYLQDINVDGVIITDCGVISLCKKVAPKLEIHLSTQANTTNAYTAKFWADYGVKRIVLARELSLNEIKQIKEIVGEDVEIECFVHGAMCISYSGRCLLSNYLTSRNGNRGECVQACRWEYNITEAHRQGQPLSICEDSRGTYILNSKDMNMLPHIDKLIEAGISSFKIEGRMKSEYYVGSVINAYRRAIDSYYQNDGKYTLDSTLVNELDKTSHRGYTTGFYFGNYDNVCLETSKPQCEYTFIAEVLGYDDEKQSIICEQRNRFFEGDTLEILSADNNFNKKLKVDEIYDENGNRVADCKYVQQKLYIKSDLKLKKHDILRKLSEE